jgi:hypothetical protein
MAIPGRIVNAGNNSDKQNVIKVVFSQPTSTIPTLEAWDDENFNTVANQVFAGTTGNGSKPMISAVATTNAAPASAWKPSSAAGGGATINRLKGNTNYVNLHSRALSGTGENVRFNLCWELPYDTDIPADLDAVFILKYSYSGSAPILTWYYNDGDAGGTESVPVWVAITSGVSGNVLRPADAGCSSSSIVLHKPVSSTVDNPELWVTAA